MQKTTKRLYLIPVLSKALDILELLARDNREMSLEAIHRETRISKTTVYRILKTFVHRGYLSQSQEGLYRQVSRPRKVRFGFGGQSAELPFSVEVTESLREAAATMGVDLMILDNRYDGPTAIRNAEEFIASRVDLIIEFQVEHVAAPIIADKIAAANIPLIAIEIPHPHSTYFGVDNYRVGLEAGRALAAHAIRHWKSKVNWVLGLDISEAGQLVQSRTTGAFEGIREGIANLPIEAFVRMDGRGLRDHSHTLVAQFLERHPRNHHILIAAANDSSALGALDAVKSLRRERHVAIVGQDCIAEAIAEMRNPASPLIASVSHETGSYGANLIQLGLALLQGQKVPPYNYVSHRLITRENLPAAEPAARPISARGNASGQASQETEG